MNPGVESVVKLLDSIGGKEEDSLVAFQQPEEDGNECVTVDIMRCPLLEKDICLI